MNFRPHHLTPIYYHSTPNQMFSPPSINQHENVPKLTKYTNPIKNLNKIVDDEDNSTRELCKKFVDEITKKISDTDKYDDDMDFEIGYSDNSITTLDCFYKNTYIDITSIYVTMTSFPRIKSMFVNFSKVKKPKIYWAIEHQNSNIKNHDIMKKVSGSSLEKIKFIGLDDIKSSFSKKKIDGIISFVGDVFVNCVPSFSPEGSFIVETSLGVDGDIILKFIKCSCIINLCDVQDKLNKWTAKNKSDDDGLNKARLYCSTSQCIIKVRFECNENRRVGKKRGRSVNGGGGLNEDTKEDVKKKKLEE